VGAKVVRPNPEVSLPGSILVVEDDSVLGPLLEMLLRGSGHTEVLLAPDAPEAMSVARSHPRGISLLITDLGLPSKRGDALARELLALYPRLRVILMSGYTDERGKPAGAPASWVMLQKPFTVERLMAAVNSSLAT
jgi:two-component system cell cycle sensor histidine kinase/response regulator CckA